MNFTPEMLMKAKEAKTAEELIALAKENNVEASEEEISAYFEANNTTGELADDELDNVAGGCGSNSTEITCPECSSTKTRKLTSKLGWSFYRCSSCGHEW